MMEPCLKKRCIKTVSITKLTKEVTTKAITLSHPAALEIPSLSPLSPQAISPKKTTTMPTPSISSSAATKKTLLSSPSHHSLPTSKVIRKTHITPISEKQFSVTKDEETKEIALLNSSLYYLAKVIVAIIFSYWDPIPAREIEICISKFGLAHLRYAKIRAVTNQHARVIGYWLKGNTILENLILNGQIPINEFRNIKTEKLDLYHIGYKDPDAIIIASLIEINTTLTELSLGDNDISGNGAQAIGNMLKINCTLETLDMSLNNIEDSGAYAIGKALEINTVLTVLRLDSNIIGDRGSTAIGNGLKINYKLKELRLQINRIGNKGVWAIAHALKSNTTLTYLNVSDNKFGFHAREELNHVMKNRCTT